MTVNRLLQILFISALFPATFCLGQGRDVPLTPPKAAVLPAAAAGETAPQLLPLTPGIREKVIAFSFAKLLQTQHISQHELDKTISKEALRLYIKSLDPRKLFFYQSDIDNFKAKYETRLCEMLLAQDIKAAFEIYNCYLDRIKERVEMVTKILDSPQDFTLDEEYIFDKPKDFTLDDTVVKAKGLQPFPKTPADAYDRWRKRMKNEILIMKADAVADAEKREKSVKDGKEPEAAEERDPIDRLKRRYTSFRKRMLLESRIGSGEVLDSIKKSANDEVMELYLNAVAGSLDPHSSYMSPSTLESFNTMMGKKLQGIGATLSSEDGYVVVKDLVKGGPADKSGEVHVKDRIQGVGQGKEGKIEDVVDFRLSDVVKMIRGGKGTVVRLEILPNGKVPAKIIEITRDEVSLEDQAAKSDSFEADKDNKGNSVIAAGKKPDGTPYKIGMIELPDFYLDMEAMRRRDPNVRSASSDVKKMLRQFVEQNVDAVIVDLRSNGGGSLHEAIELTGLFIETGPVVQTKDEANARPQVRVDPNPGCEWTGPLVVLTNKFSASASEIFAGAIKDYKRGLIIGDSTTHGKGTVQTVADLSERILSGLNGMGTVYGAGKITIQGFYRPSGVSTQRIGVEADVVLPSLTDVMEDISEADLDNALTLKAVAAAPGSAPKTVYVTPQMTANLQKRSNDRIKDVKDFAKVLDKISAYKEVRAKRSASLNEQKYMEEVKKFNADEWEREELEDMLNKDKKIKHDFYLDEVFAITGDYLRAMQESGIVFPKEKSTQGKRSWFGF
ncbi:MAG: carboxy terminal-processing peptidase [Planctomycetaceae bacterium]|jgi:carboxyl-terminal processing protease|nr:carboxy terminal-processing peptidase [Planctomycetaceae bacterium]